VSAGAFAILVAGWIGWMTPFFLIQRGRGAAQTIDRRARWGIVLQGIGFALVFWRLGSVAVAAWRAALAVIFFVAAAALSWSSTRALGRQWRIDAGLNADHRLIQTGAYRLVRHPIYASMLALLVGVGFLNARWPLFAAAVVLHLLGIEIRVHIEDRLLASRFGDEFRAYQNGVPAYMPFLR
jgi:protein-S-isoprenylcysteine O-methyltransferase Ste14